MLAAVEKGDAKNLAELMRQDPGFDVNEQKKSWSLLRTACRYGQDSIVTLLLAHPDIDVNLASSDEWSPFYTACYNGHTSCVREMLKDSRVNVNQLANGFPPLWDVAVNGHLEIIKWWIASGREMDLGKPGDRKTPLGRQRGKRRQMW